MITIVTSQLFLRFTPGAFCRGHRELPALWQARERADRALDALRAAEQALFDLDHRYYIGGFYLDHVLDVLDDDAVSTMPPHKLRRLARSLFIDIDFSEAYPALAPIPAPYCAPLKTLAKAMIERADALSEQQAREREFLTHAAA